MRYLKLKNEILNELQRLFSFDAVRINRALVNENQFPSKVNLSLGIDLDSEEMKIVDEICRNLEVFMEKIVGEI